MKVKASQKLIPAVAMLLVSAVALGSASYAWFTMSRTVTATDMTLEAVAPTNLLIANAETGTYGETAKVAANYENALIYPASSVNGTKFYAAEEIKSTMGGKPDATTVFTDVSDKAMAKDTDGYYADFNFWLKTDGGKDVDVAINDVACTIKNNSTVTDGKPDITKAVRFAILDGTGAAFTTEPANTGVTKATNNLYSFPETGAVAYFEGLKGPIATNAEASKATNFEGQENTIVNNYGSLFTCGKDGTPVKVTIRVWIEGQDAKCITDNAKCNFTIEVGFKDALYTVPVPTPDVP